MSKIEKMSLAEIIDQIGLCLTEDAVYDIWEEDAVPERNVFNPRGVPVSEKLKDRIFVSEMINNNDGEALSRFLHGHESEINKIKLALNMLETYETALERRAVPPEKVKAFESNISVIRKLLKDVDEVFIYCSRDEETGRIESLKIVSTQIEAKGGKRFRRAKNNQKLREIEEKKELVKIIEQVSPNVISFISTYSPEVANEIISVINYNTALEELNGDKDLLTSMCENGEFKEFIKTIERSKFAPAMDKILRQHIEQLDIDKLLLCAGSGFIEAINAREIPEEDLPEIYSRLQIIQKNLKKNASITIKDINNQTLTYDMRDFTSEMQRFIVSDGKIEYLTTEKCVEIREGLAGGSVFLYSLRPEEVEALQLSPQDKKLLLEVFPENYIYFLRKGELVHSREYMLKNIINSNECSQELLKLLCETADLTTEEIHQLFDKGIISVADLDSIKELKKDLISHDKLFEKYRQYRDSDQNHKEENRIELERYALAYRTIKLLGKNDAEIEANAGKFIEAEGDDIESPDLINLYGLDIIPLKVAVDWGGEDIIEKLVQSEKLKPSDARYLRDTGLLDEKVLEKIFINNPNMSYSYQVALVCTVFDGQTPEEHEIKENLAQYYHIENGIINPSKRGVKGRKSNPSEPGKHPQQRVKMRDPGAKYNLLSNIDSGVKIEEGIIDGHIIFHYPNIDKGVVLIEKLHKISTNRETGLIEIRADNSAATYVILEEEFIKIKSALIQYGKIDRTQLTQRWFRNPGNWIAHIGNNSWEKGIKSRFDINPENPRYSDPKDLAKMEKLLLESSKSKDIGER